MFGVLIHLQCISISAVVCRSGFFQSGATAVHYAAKHGFQEVLKFLVEKGGTVNAQTKVSITEKKIAGVCKTVLRSVKD